MEAAVFDALFLLFRTLAVYWVFSFSRSLASNSKCRRLKAYLWAIGVSGFIALMCWSSYGTHTEGDPVPGGLETVVDFVPTYAERNKHGIFIFVAIGLTSLVGTHMGLKDRG